MPIVRPFRALRYTPSAGNIRDLTAPPYDIIYDQWRDRLYARNPYNIIRLIKTRDEPGEGEPDDKYLRAAGYLDSWMDAGVMRMEAAPSLYVCADTYEMDGVTRTRYGFIMLVKAEEFGRGIYAHERTLSGPKVDRLHLVKATETNLSQIFGIYSDPRGEVQEIILQTVKGTPDIDFTDEQGIGRRMWTVSDPAVIGAVEDCMRDREVIIADGHHRYETALAYRQFMEPHRRSDDEPFDYVSMYFSNVDDPGLLILPTHRKAGGMDGFDRKRFLAELAEHFEVDYPVRAETSEILDLMREGIAETSVFGIYLGGLFGIIRLKNPRSPKELDVEILHNLIIERVLGISREDIASGKYLHFSKSADHVIEDVDAGKEKIGFLMNGIRPEEMFPRVITGERLPQKSTYFYPKTVSGLVMYRIQRETIE
jgi:uncharacterized protein (DUF1015 family)